MTSPELPNTISQVPVFSQRPQSPDVSQKSGEKSRNSFLGSGDNDKKKHKRKNRSMIRDSSSDNKMAPLSGLNVRRVSTRSADGRSSGKDKKKKTKATFA